MSLTGRHADGLSLTPGSIRPNGIQAEGRSSPGWTAPKFSVGIALLCLVEPVARQEDISCLFELSVSCPDPLIHNESFTQSE